jgi:hypothetical protein
MKWALLLTAETFFSDISKDVHVVAVVYIEMLEEF